MVYEIIKKSAVISFIAAAVSLLGISCTAYRNFSMEVLEPSSISIDINKKLALYDRNVRNADSDLRIEEEESEYHLLREFANGLNNRIIDLKKDTIIFIKNQHRTLLKDGESPQCLSSDIQASLYQEYNIDYLLSLEMISYKMWREDVHCYWLLRLYQQGSDIPLDSVVIDKSLLADVEMPDAMFDELAATYWDGGYAYAHRIVPTWIKTERRIYKQGRVFALGNAYMETEQFEKAAELWRKVAKMHNIKAIKAHLNLACLCEYMGDFMQAQYYLLQAQKLTQTIKARHQLIDYLQKYMKILNDRIYKESILEKQINIGS